MRTQRSFKNYLTKITHSGVHIIAGMIATPYLLKWLGTERYGTYWVILDWLGYLTLLEMGLAEAFIPLASNATSKTELRQHIITTIRAYFKITPLKLLAGGIFVYFSSNLVGKTSLPASELQIACSIGVLSSLLSVFSPFRTLLEVNQQGYKLNTLLVYQSIITTALSLLFAKNGFGLPGHFLAVFLGSLHLIYACTRKANSELTGILSELWVNQDHQHSKKSLRKLNMVMFFSNLCSRIGFMTDGIIISFLLNATSVANFYITQKAVMIVQTLLYAIGNSTWAAMVELYNKGEKETFSKRLIELTRLTMIAGALFLGPIIVMNSSFISLWVGADQFAGNKVTVLSCVNILILALTSLWSWIFGAKGLARSILPSYIFATVLNLAGSFLLTWKLGLTGPLLGSVIANITVTFWLLPKYIQRHFEISSTKIYTAVFKPLLIQIPAVSALYLAVNHYPTTDWINFVIKSTLCLFFMFSVTWILIFSAEEKSLWRHRLNLVLTRN